MAQQSSLTKQRRWRFSRRQCDAGQVFTREDLSSAQQMFGRIAADFMRTEVLPREKEIYARTGR
jgi:hypothetical protein